MIPYDVNKVMKNRKKERQIGYVSGKFGMEIC